MNRYISSPDGDTSDPFERVEWRNNESTIKVVGIPSLHGAGPCNIALLFQDVMLAKPLLAHPLLIFCSNSGIED